MKLIRITNGPLLGIVLAVAGPLLSLSCGDSSTSPGGTTSPGATPKVFDAVADFSSTTNSTSSTWSYRYRDGLTRDGTYRLISSYGPAGPAAWMPTNPGAWSVGGFVPAIGVNRTATDATYEGSSLTWPKGTMLVHPGANQLVVLSWLSPSDATAAFDFSLTSLDATCGNGIAWFVARNDSGATLASGSIGSGGSSGSRSLSSVSVRAGDRINFVVVPNSDFLCDTTKLTATITTS